MNITWIVWKKQGPGRWSNAHVIGDWQGAESPSRQGTAMCGRIIPAHNEMWDVSYSRWCHDTPCPKCEKIVEKK